MGVISSRLYGRRKGRGLHVRKTALMQSFLPQVQITLSGEKGLTAGSLFGTPAPLILEIGFGGGEHLAAQAKRNPEMRFIGCEPFVNGIASLLDHLERDRITNVRVFADDARVMLDALADASVETCFVLFADPWPKKKHRERRFIGPDSLSRLARVLKPKGLLRVASDHPQLIAWTRAQLDGSPAFRCAYADSVPPPDWIPTRYQEKALQAGRVPVFMDYRRVDAF